MEIPLEERAARAAEEERKRQADVWEKAWRSLYDEIVPRAVKQVEDVLGVTTAPDDWGMPTEAPHDTDMAFASTEIGGVKIVIRQNLRIDYSRPSAHSDSYLSSYFYDGYVILPSEQKLEPLTLAAFGEAQNQAQTLRQQQETEQKTDSEGGEKHSGTAAYCDMWAMLIAVAEGQDDASIRLIWDNGNQLKMMEWAIAAIFDGLRKRDIDPLDFARYSIKHALSTEEAEEGKEG